MILRSGKYQGYTIDEVQRIAPWYIQWVKQNRPEMLKEHTPKKKKVVKPMDSEDDIPHSDYKNIKPATLEEAF